MLCQQSRLHLRLPRAHPPAHPHLVAPDSSHSLPLPLPQPRTLTLPCGTIGACRTKTGEICGSVSEQSTQACGNFDRRARKTRYSRTSRACNLSSPVHCTYLTSYRPYRYLPPVPHRLTTPFPRHDLAIGTPSSTPYTPTAVQSRGPHLGPPVHTSPACLSAQSWPILQDPRISHLPLLPSPPIATAWTTVPRIHSMGTPWDRPLQPCLLCKSRHHLHRRLNPQHWSRMEGNTSTFTFLPLHNLAPR